MENAKQELTGSLPLNSFNHSLIEFSSWRVRVLIIIKKGVFLQELLNIFGEDRKPDYITENE